MRPGYLGTIDELHGKNFEPPPGPPPKGTWKGTQRIKFAINKKTKKYYAQDPGCPPGEKRKKCGEIKKPVGPCMFTECCDVLHASGPYPFIGPVCYAECDHPDTPTDCDDDPDYLEFPEKVYKTCPEVKAAFKAAGIPDSFANTYCEDEDIPDSIALPKPKPVAQQSRSMTRQGTQALVKRPLTKEEMVRQTVRAREARARRAVALRKRNVGYGQGRSYGVKSYGGLGLGGGLFPKLGWTGYALVGVVGLLILSRV